MSKITYKRTSEMYYLLYHVQRPEKLNLKDFTNIFVVKGNASKLFVFFEKFCFRGKNV